MKRLNKSVELKKLTKKWLLFILISINSIVYLHTIQFGFSYFDDDAIIIRNEEFLKDFSNSKYTFTRDAEFQEKRIELYRPLQNLSYFIDSALFGFKPFGFHFTNLLLHLINVFVLFFLLLSLGLKQFNSFWLTLLFSIHPMFAFTVSWIPARGDLILALWSMISIWSFVEYAKSRNIKLLSVHLLTFALALFSKENALALIPICYLYYFLVLGKRIIVKDVIIPVLFYIGISALYFYLRSHSISDIKEGNFEISNFIHNLSGIAESVFYFIIPFDIPLLAFYKISISIIGWLLLGFILFIGFYKNKNYKFQLWLVLSFLFLFLPSMLYKPHWSDFIYDYLVHRNYFPMVFLSLFLFSISQFKFSFFKQDKQVIILSVLAIVYIVLNFNFSKSFQNQKSFWTTAVEKNPNSAFAQNYLGNFLFLEGNPTTAIVHFNKSLELKPDFQDAWFNLGNAYIETQEFEKANHAFSLCLHYDSLNTKALNLRASCNLQLKKYKESLLDLNKLIVLEPNNFDHLYNRALFYFITKDFQLSEKDLENMFAKNKEDERMLKLYSVVLLMNDKSQKSLEIAIYFQSNNPNNIEAINNLAYAEFENDHFSKSIELFKKALEKEPKNLDSFLGLLISQNKISKEETQQLLKQRLSDFTVLQQKIGVVDELEKNGFIFSKKQKTALHEIF